MEARQMSKSKKRRLRKKATGKKEQSTESLTYEQLIDKIKHKPNYIATIQFIQDWHTNKDTWKFKVPPSTEKSPEKGYQFHDVQRLSGQGKLQNHAPLSAGPEGRYEGRTIVI